MFRIRIVPVTICLFLSSLLCAQSNVRLHGTVVNEATGTALAGVHVKLLKSDRGTTTDEQGNFEFLLVRGRSVVLQFSFVGYTTIQRKLSAFELEAGSKLVIALVSRMVELPAVTITLPGPELVYQREDLHVGDYHANDQGLWVLTYERPQYWHRDSEAGAQVFREARLHLLDTNFVELCSVRIPGDAVRLHHDHANRTIVEGTRKAWITTLVSKEVLLSVIELKTLREQILPWTDSLPDLLLGSTMSKTYPAFEHIGYNLGTKETRVLCQVQEDHTMELFRSQYKYMTGRDKVIAMDLEKETGIEREIIAGYMTGFQNDPYFVLPYAPLFVIHDTLCIFDHAKGMIHRSRSDLTAINDVPINYQKDRNWSERLIQNRANGSVYAVYSKNLRTWLRKVDPSTGNLGPMNKLTHPFPEEVQVHGRHVYYVYRPYGSLQHRTLYREAIR